MTTWAAPAQDLIDQGFQALGGLVAAHIPPGLFASFLTDGVISGVGSVLVFLPQILVLFLFIILLEDSGYMARAAFLMDRIMGGAGLHGRAFIPLLSSFACAIPGIMATRVIDNRRDRLTTILVAPLMTCSARIPVYTLIISAFIPARTVWGGIQLQGLVMFALYATGILSALAVALVLKRIVWPNDADPFLLEGWAGAGEDAAAEVVVLGQDPYHGDGQAHGLCFSVQPGIKIPPSLVNIYKELQSDLGIPPARHGFLEHWARQGVLLLNSVLTVERSLAASHQGRGWERFTDAVIARVNEQESPAVFMLWGSHAQRKAAFVDQRRHLVLKAPHPSPLSAHNGFFGSRHFSRANEFLKSQGLEPIDWQLPERPEALSA